MREEVEAEAEALVDEDSGDIMDMEEEEDAFEMLLRREPKALDTVNVLGETLFFPE
jgi:hypothetical protein